MMKVMLLCLLAFLMIGNTAWSQVPSTFGMFRAQSTPPSYIQEAETAWNTTTSPKTTTSFNVLAGDVLIAYAIKESDNNANTAVSGGSLTWYLVGVADTDSGNYTEVRVWAAVVDSNKSMTVTFTNASGSKFGGNVLTFRGSSGAGASVSALGASGAPSVNITTRATNSAVVVVNGDWSAVDGSSRTWRLSPIEASYDRDSLAYTIYGAYHPNIGAVGTYTVGLSAPTGQKYSIVAVEVLSSSAAPTFCNGTSSPAVGTVCSDGSVFAGYSVDGNYPMYTTPNDGGLYPWNNGNSSGQTATSQLNGVTGNANTTASVALDSDSITGGTQPHQAAQYCYDLVAHGKSDWYLPANSELDVLYTNRSAIGNFNLTGTDLVGYYWSSTEQSTNEAYIYRFSDGYTGQWNKYWGNNVRCVRKN